MLWTSGTLRIHRRSVPLDECSNSVKLSMCERKKECPSYPEIGNYMLFCFRKLLFKIFILPMHFLKQAVHKLFSFLCLFYTQKGIDTRLFKFEHLIL